ncbi:MAG: RecQ family ATP-dependent DNA helicase [Flavobacteriaceae bacterium]|nr:RecQ family ATP-dependent DNA helicase [Flavobacteriaceae bacterium]
MEHPVEILERYWNYKSFKPLQEDIIEAVLNNEDTFALLPTGGGKSICFQIPALIKEGICIVVSPLIALMKDQVQSLKEKDIKAMALTSEYKYNEIDTMLDNCIYGNYKFLYLSPERLQQEIVQERIRQMNVNLIAVDEAHCISQWGNDFRPAYKNIRLLRTLQPSVNVLALTATATLEVVDDIVIELDLIDTKIFRQSFKRDNLAYMVFDEEDKNYRLTQLLKADQKSAIVYVRNRKSTVQISKFIEDHGLSSTYYHGGLTPNEKADHFEDWKYDRKQIMVATNAFGMGIDKGDVTNVIHMNLPESIESYFQEAGRAGRNGQEAFAIILKNKGDETHVKNQFLSVLPTVDFIKDLYRKLCNYFQISYGEGEFSTHDFNFAHFCKTYQFNTLIAYNAFQVLDRTSVIKLSQQFRKGSSAQFVVSNKELFSYLEKAQIAQIIVKSILRTYGGIFDYQTKLNTLLIAGKAEASEEEVIDTLIQLEKDGIITLQLSTTDAQITFLEPREDDKTINRIADVINQQNQLKQKQVMAVIAYVNNDDACKSVQLLKYFGETKIENCGICSVCRKDKGRPSGNLLKQHIDQILELLSENELSSRQIGQQLSLKDNELLEVLKLMLEQQMIEITLQNSYKLKSA